MAENLLGIITCNSNIVAPTYDSGDRIEVYWNDSTDAFRVSYYDASAGTTNDVSSGDPILKNHIRILKYYSVTGVQNQLTFVSNYSFCTGTTLTDFPFIENFPYFEKRQTLDSPSCDLSIICDLIIIGSPKIGLASDSETADGQITITAYSTSPVRFTLSDRDRYSELPSATDNGNDTYTYTFTGLLPGTYKIYALDSIGCSTSKTVYVAYDKLGNYGLYYYFDITDNEPQTPKTYRAQILKKDYSGASNEITYSAQSPIQITLRGENRGMFQSIVPSEIILSLSSETHLEYLDLFATNDTEYLVRIYFDPNDTNVLIHQGYIQPQKYGEDITAGPFEVEIFATDRLGDLEAFDFIDEVQDPLDDENIIRTPIKGSNTVLDILWICLNKLELNQTLRSGFNLYETNHNSTASDDPLTQTYINCDTYYDEDGEPLSCKDVVDNICTSLGARLFSYEGIWYFIRVEEQKNSSIAYRQFDYTSNYVSNGTISPLLDFKAPTDTDRARWLASGNRVEIEEIFNKINIIKNRDIAPNLFPSFNDINLVDGFFEGWTINLNGDSASITAKEVPKSVDVITENSIETYLDVRKHGKYTYSPRRTREVTKVVEVKESTSTALSLNYLSFGDGGNSYVSTSGTVEYSSSDTLSIKLNFTFKTLYASNPPYVNSKWMFKVGSKYLKADGTWTASETINSQFVTEYNKETSYTISGSFDPDVTTATTATYEFRIYDISPFSYDYTAANKSSLFTTIAGISTTLLISGYRIIGRYNSGAGYQYWYFELTDVSNVTGSDFAITPGDNSNLRWILTKQVYLEQVTLGAGVYLPLSNTSFFDVNFSFFPDGVTLPEEEKTSFTVSSGNVRDLDYDVYHFDLNTDINNTEQIVRNYFMLSNGNPTSSWGSENKEIQNILAETLAKLLFPQGSSDKRGALRVSANFILDRIIYMYNSMRDPDDNNRTFIINALTWDLKSRIVSGVELVELGSSTATSIKAHQDNAHDAGHN